MKISEILKKVLEGAELTDADKTALSKFDPEKLNAQVETLTAENVTLKADAKAAGEAKAAAEKVVEDAKKAGMTELEKIQIELKTAQASNAALEAAKAKAESELAGMKRTAKIGAISKKHGFEPAAYLDYLLGKNSVDIENDEAVGTFLGNVKKENPKFFKAEISPGVETPKPPQQGQPAAVPADRVGNIIGMLKNAPEVK